MITATWRPTGREFVVRCTALHAEGHLIQALPGAVFRPREGGYVVPEVAVCDLAALLRKTDSAEQLTGALPAGYDAWLQCQAVPLDASLIPAVTAGGRRLRQDQREDAAGLLAGTRTALFNDPGTGKTCVVGAAFEALRAAPYMSDAIGHSLAPGQPVSGLLWVAPLATLGQIADELREVFRIESATVDKWAGEPVMLTNYEKTYRDRWSPVIRQFIQDRYAVVYIDEAHRVGNGNQHSDQLMAWRWIASHRWAGTGTPIQNRLQSFHRPYVWCTGANVDAATWERKFTLKSTGEVNERTFPQLSAIVKPWATRRRKVDVMGDVPYTEVVRRVPLTGRQLQMYQASVKAKFLEVRGLDEQAWEMYIKNPFERLLRELQICRDPRLLGEEMKDDDVAKSVALDDLLEELDGHKVVIWSGHPRILNRVVEKHGGVAYHGEITQAQRPKNKQRFLEDPACRLLAANYTVAGTGMDGLQKVCSHAIVLDLPAASPDWRQLQDRLHRVGQSNPVTTYVLLAANTVEERWQYRLLQSKAAVEAAMLGDKPFAKKVKPLRKEELLEVLGGKAY